MHRKSIAELSDALRSKQISSVELTEIFLKRIESLDVDLNSFISVTRDHALQQARRADDLIASGTSSTLTGIPIAHKDLFCTKGVRTTCGSRMLENFVAPYDATIVERLEAQGMVMLGKTNMDEFAMGSSNENSYFGPVGNPWRTSHVPGGSSGGSAAAVAASLTPIATATDTGGSIRQPAALCGLTGIKPTYGRVSRYGLVAFASSLDQAGVLARRAEDIALVLQAMAGFDPRDSTSSEQAVRDYRAELDTSVESLTIGVPSEYFDEGVDEVVRIAVKDAMTVFEKMGVKLKSISLPNSSLAIPTYYVVAPAECSSNLSRFDGVRYGHRIENPSDLENLYVGSRTEGFGAEVKRRIMIGTYVLSAGYFDAYYLKAQKVRRLISDDFQKAFQDVDLILGPTTPETAFAIGEKTDDPVTMYMSDVFTTAANLAGVPAISLPVGQHNGLPIGLQLIGNYFDESRLLSTAHQYQRETHWHNLTPKDFA